MFASVLYNLGSKFEQLLNSLECDLFCLLSLPFLTFLYDQLTNPFPHCYLSPNMSHASHGDSSACIQYQANRKYLHESVGVACVCCL